VGIGWREVKVGSSRCRRGVESALRFWLMVSSIVEREARRKSVPVSRGRGGEGREGETFQCSRRETELWAQWRMVKF
jgi:hypothetical protein